MTKDLKEGSKTVIWRQSILGRAIANVTAMGGSLPAAEERHNGQCLEWSRTVSRRVGRGHGVWHPRATGMSLLSFGGREKGPHWRVWRKGKGGMPTVLGWCKCNCGLCH